MNAFLAKVHASGLDLKKGSIEILQVNLGKLCNLTCVHCHVEAGPTKTQENMGETVAREVLAFLDRVPVKTLDLTGGAPEMNPHFRTLVREARKRNLNVIDRCNLTILSEPGQEDLALFLKEQGVEVVASLPCYSKDNVDKQRGDGTFMTSIEALKQLNRLGYGKSGTGLLLSLVYNPVGAHLPPDQVNLETEYKQRLKEDFGVEFNRLYAIANMPITRYAKYLKAFGQYETYVDLLRESFNLQTIKGLMCRNTLSVRWDGSLYDCDFNQALDMKIRNGKPYHIQNVTAEDLEGLTVLTADHCYGCTAGSGSSCQGALG